MAAFIVLAFIFGLILTIHFAPSIVAYKRKNPNFRTILLINVFFGWNLIGWVVCLVMSLEKDERVNCEYCHEKIHPLASICPHCNSARVPNSTTMDPII